MVIIIFLFVVEGFNNCCMFFDFVKFDNFFFGYFCILDFLYNIGIDF